ncbi:MAG: hypothetical protein MNPFHGCM_02172 [Gemmatimonadaceae bacterium]|nr:hypothetical protein [Gemmatimonadaceae bacterium]
MRTSAALRGLSVLRVTGRSPGAGGTQATRGASTSTLRYSRTFAKESTSLLKRRWSMTTRLFLLTERPGIRNRTRRVARSEHGGLEPMATSCHVSSPASLPFQPLIGNSDGTNCFPEGECVPGPAGGWRDGHSPPFHPSDSARGRDSRTVRANRCRLARSRPSVCGTWVTCAHRGTRRRHGSLRR